LVLTALVEDGVELFEVEVELEVDVEVVEVTMVEDASSVIDETSARFFLRLSELAETEAAGGKRVLVLVMTLVVTIVLTDTMVEVEEDTAI